MSEQRKFVTTAPENSETPLESVRSWVTPNRLFFVRNHFAVPNLLRRARGGPAGNDAGREQSKTASNKQSHDREPPQNEQAAGT